MGCVENLLTCNRVITQITDVDSQMEPDFPIIEFITIDVLYNKFKLLIKTSVDLTNNKGAKHATRDIVKKVSDVIWSSLTRSFYKDRAHLQNLYSYLTGNKLDCFGVAFAVVAACQVLGLLDVHLALSEDHAWVIFGKDKQESAEVTWHGKGNEDKRGQPILQEMLAKSWLYCNGHPVYCTRHMEVAALVSSINPTINATTDSVELSLLQRDLLWILYERGDLRRYPMALGNLGDLEEISPSPGRPQSLELLREAILASKSYYNNMHVYPYTYLGGYFFRNQRFKDALEAWANAANVIRNYNYSRDDEEIYKEFLEIVTELIPHIMKVADSGLLRDAECYASLLRFYDGLCAWEEESPTPILHIGWAKPLVSTIAKFPTAVRSTVRIEEEATPETPVNGSDQRPQEIIRNLIDAPSASPPHPNIAALAAACADNILNPEYLLGSGEPFSTRPTNNTDLASNGTNFSSLTMEPAAHRSPLLLQTASAPVPPEQVKVTLSSKKMADLKELLPAEKLNTSAIQLLLTAQSQVHVTKRSGSHSSFSVKRTRHRE